MQWLFILQQSSLCATLACPLFYIYDISLVFSVDNRLHLYRRLLTAHGKPALGQRFPSAY